MKSTVVCAGSDPMAYEILPMNVDLSFSAARWKRNPAGPGSRISPRLFQKLAAWVSALLLCPALQGQAPAQAVSERDPRVNRAPASSDLAVDNYSRVAASAAQIKTVLVRDAGLM